MSKGVRLVIFLVFIGAFLVLAPIIVLYASGLRFDFARRTFVATGALFLNPYPKNSSIFLNGVIRKETSLFSPNAFFNRLTPKTYTVRIERPGSHAWEKSLEVLAGATTEARHILIIPKNPMRKTVMSPYAALGWSATKNGTHMLIWSGVSQPRVVAVYQDHERREIVDISALLPPDTLPEYALFDPNQKPIAILKVRIGDNAQANVRWFLIDLSNNDTPLALELPAETHTAQFAPGSFSNSEETRIILELREIGTDNGPMLHDIRYIITKQRLDLVRTLEQHALALFPQANRLLLLDARGILFALFEQGNAEQLTFYSVFEHQTDADANMKQPEAWKIFAGTDTEHNIAVRSPSGVLYLLNLKERSFVPFAESVVDARFSKNGTKLLWHTRFELWAGYLQKQEEQPKHKEGEKELLVRYLEPIRTAFWYPGNDQHAVYAVGNALKVTELDGRDHRNIADLYVGARPDFTVLEGARTLLAQDEDTLWEIEVPIPPRYDFGVIDF